MRIYFLKRLSIKNKIYLFNYHIDQIEIVIELQYRFIVGVNTTIRLIELIS